MATVEKWTPFGVALDITATNGGVTRTSATQYTVKINASWVTYYSGAQTNYGMTASSGGKSVNLNTFGNKASSGSGSFIGTYSISGNGSATKTITVAFKNYNNDNGDSATKNVTFNVTVPAWTSYIISYNANGGSGAPSSQTKWKNQALTISSTKPTRIGYAFKGWALSKSDADNGTWYYQAGGSCGKNENLTLYATWEEYKLTVNYYSNYADYGTYQGKKLDVSYSTNVKVHSQDFLYDNSYSSGLSNIQNTSYLYLSRNGYIPTGYWGTSTTGGTLIDEDTQYSTGQALAKVFGKDISNGNASVNVYPQWEATTYYIVDFDASGGTGTMNTLTLSWNELFILPENMFKKIGHDFVGWNLHRNIDDKWYVDSKGWYTEEEIATYGYEKKLYQDGLGMRLDDSWTNGADSAKNFTFYAIWKISDGCAMVYIDNNSTFEPYLIYIDNGLSWDLYVGYVDNGSSWDMIS